MTTSANHRGAGIAMHYQRVWQSEPSLCEWPDFALRARDLPEGFAVLRFPPAEGMSTWKYATVCMSSPGDDHPIELHMLCDGPEDACAKMLTVTAHYHRTGARLGVGHSVNFGQPWVANSKCSFGLLSLPYLGGPAWEWCRLDDGDVVRCLWLLPITPEEVAFKKANGLDALEARFEASGFDYGDPSRPSIM